MSKIQLRLIQRQGRKHITKVDGLPGELVTLSFVKRIKKSLFCNCTVLRDEHGTHTL